MYGILLTILLRETTTVSHTFQKNNNYTQIQIYSLSDTIKCLYFINCEPFLQTPQYMIQCHIWNNKIRDRTQPKKVFFFKVPLGQGKILNLDNTNKVHFCSASVLSKPSRSAVKKHVQFPDEQSCIEEAAELPTEAGSVPKPGEIFLRKRCPKCKR